MVTIDNSIDIKAIPHLNTAPKDQNVSK